MTDNDRTFTVANDAALISLIESAKNRLVIIGPSRAKLFKSVET